MRRSERRRSARVELLLLQPRKPTLVRVRVQRQRGHRGVFVLCGQPPRPVAVRSSSVHGSRATITMCSR
jgi:hypothetical protein